LLSILATPLPHFLAINELQVNHSVLAEELSDEEFRVQRDGSHSARLLWNFDLVMDRESERWEKEAWTCKLCDAKGEKVADV
jgi:hypothetical protein